MISKESLKILSLPIRFGYKICCFPLKWKLRQDGSGTLEKVGKKDKKYLCWQIMSAIHMLTRIGFVIFWIYNIPRENSSKAILHCLFTLILFAIAIIHITVRMSHQDIYLILNATLEINGSLVVFYKIPHNKVDKIEAVLKLLSNIGIFIVVTNTPICFLMLESNAEVMDFINFHQHFWNLLLSLFFGYTFMVDWILVILIMLSCLLYLRNTLGWLRRLAWSSNESNYPRRICLRSQYRTHQLLFKKVEEDVKIIFPVMVSVINLLTIVALFSFVKFYDVAHPMFFPTVLGATVLSVFIVHLLYSFMWRISEASIQYPRSYLRNDPTGLRKMDHLFFKACSPIEYKAFGMSVITNKSFTVMMKDLVLSSALTLILTF